VPPPDSIAGAADADEFEVSFEEGVTDGLPVPPPTRERVERMLFAENEGASPWPPCQVRRGLTAAASAVTRFAGDAPHGISDHSSGHAALRRRQMVEGRSQASTVRDRATARTERSARHGSRRGHQSPVRHTRDPDVMISKFPSIEEIRVVVADETAGHTHHAINSIDFFSGACHSSRRFWHKRSQVTIVRDRDTRRAGPVRAAFLFALQSRRVTPPQWREHRGLKTP
jgi:hypothetical protein